MSNCGIMWRLALSAIVLASSTVGYGQLGVSSEPGGPEVLYETGLGPQPFETFTLSGDFVVASANTRVNFEGAFQPEPMSQIDPFAVTVSCIPTGSTVVRAFANWSYLTYASFPPELAEITINGTAVTGDLTGEADRDLCWQRTRTVAYTADVTAIVAQVGGNGVYQIGGAVDEAGAYGEGFSLLVVYSNPLLPERQINVYSGMIVVTEPGQMQGTYGFQSPYYQGGPGHFFINALDGQGNANVGDDFFINDTKVSGSLNGTAQDGDAWRGLVGQSPINNLYDHAEDDVATLMSLSDMDLTIRTDAYEDCVGHSFGAISFVMDPCEGVSDPDPVDCNNNHLSDECEIINGISRDCNENGVPDECDPADGDSDGDGIFDDCDNCPDLPNPCQEDGDVDGMGDVCDNCPEHHNPGQEDMDEDGVGDVCDNCPEVYNPGQEDCGGNGVGDACDADSDADGIPDDCDNCPSVYNPDQADCDGDGEGDACEGDDLDDDGVPDEQDNCECHYNPDQIDCDDDGHGNACDPTPSSLFDFDGE